MIKLLIIVVIVVIFKFLYDNKIVFRFETLLRKGFKVACEKFGTYCFCGKMGSGKTYSVVDFIDSIRSKDMKVVTNVLSYANKNKDFCIYEPDFYKIIDNFTNGVYDYNYIIFYDEIFTLLEKGKLNRSILAFISQLRKMHVYLVTTAQEWLEINVTFRRYVRYQVDCKMFNFANLCAFSINEINDGYSLKWSNEDNEYIAPRIKTTIKKCSKKLADSYDTFEVIKTA